jgi:hypothetical protein
MSRPPSRASVKSQTSTKSKTPSRPSTADNGAALFVDMGDVGWISSTGHHTTVAKSVGKDTKAKSDGTKRGLFTKSMATCFTVIVLGGDSGNIMVHVSAYLADAKAHKKEPELEAITKNFAAAWKTNHFTATSARLVVIKGPWTQEPQMNQLLGHIFPQLAGVKKSALLSCEREPVERTKDHGTALLRYGQAGTEIFVEGRKAM